MKSADGRMLSRYVSVALWFVTAALTVSQARADLWELPSDVYNYGVLYEGTGGHTLSFNNGTFNGNMGVGGTGQFAMTSGTFNGNLFYSASNTSQTSFTNGTWNGAANLGSLPAGSIQYGQSNITTDLTAINTFATDLGNESGT